MKFADTPKGWYQERACNILASLSLAIEAHNRMKSEGDYLHWTFYHTMEHHFERAILDTLRLLDYLAHDAHFANTANLQDICERGHTAFVNIIDGNMDKFDLERD